MNIKSNRAQGFIPISMAIIALVFFITGFPSPLKAQGTCRTHTDCPCGQGCELTVGQCRNLFIPFCAIDEECSGLDRELFSGRCVNNLCELTCQAPPADDPVARRIAATPPGGTVKLGAGVVSTNARIEGQIVTGAGTKCGVRPRQCTEVRPLNPNLPVFTISNGALTDMTISGGVAAIRGVAQDSSSGATRVSDVKIVGTSRTATHGMDGSYASIATNDLVISNTKIAAQLHLFGPALLQGLFLFENQFGIMIFDEGTPFDPGIYEISGLNSSGKCGGECMHNNDFGNIYVKGNGFFSTEVHISDCFINDGGGFGILLEEVSGEINDTCINSIDPNSNGEFGDGVSLFNAIATLTDSVVSNSARSGVSVFCPVLPSAINISGTLFVDNAINLDKECDFFAAFQDGGGNVCIENGNTVACKALSSVLDPPKPLP